MELIFMRGPGCKYYLSCPRFFKVVATSEMEIFLGVRLEAVNQAAC